MKTVREEALIQLITARLSQDQRISGQPIEVIVEHEEVLLVGSCDTEDQRLIAESIVRGMGGVRTIVVNIRVRPVRAWI